jgi:hypothetical protein
MRIAEVLMQGVTLKLADKMGLMDSLLMLSRA